LRHRGGSIPYGDGGGQTSQSALTLTYPIQAPPSTANDAWNCIQERFKRLTGFGILAFCAKLSFPAEVAKLADAPDLGSGGAILRGSSPLLGKLVIGRQVTVEQGVKIAVEVQAPEEGKCLRITNGIATQPNVLQRKRLVITLLPDRCSSENRSIRDQKKCIMTFLCPCLLRKDPCRLYGEFRNYG
jgi:hypothetical protein